MPAQWVDAASLDRESESVCSNGGDQRQSCAEDRMLKAWCHLSAGAGAGCGFGVGWGFGGGLALAWW